MFTEYRQADCWYPAFISVVWAETRAALLSVHIAVAT